MKSANNDQTFEDFIKDQDTGGSEIPILINFKSTMKEICKQVADNATTAEEKEQKLNETNVRFIFRNDQVDPFYHQRNSPYLSHENLEARLMPKKKFLGPPKSTVTHAKRELRVSTTVSDNPGGYPNDRRSKWK